MVLTSNFVVVVAENLKKKSWCSAFFGFR